MILPGRRAVLSATAFLAVLAARTVQAGDTAIAEELFREGKALMRAHDYARGCPKLAESFRQDPATGTLLALAVCQEEAGQLASAWATYKDVVARASQEGRTDRETAARQRAEALEPRLSTLRVDVAPEVARLPGLVVARDGMVLAPAAWGSPLPTDSGPHVVDVTAEGRTALRQTVVVGREGDRKVVTIGDLVPSPPGPNHPDADDLAPKAAAADVVVVADGRAGAGERRGRSLRMAGIVSGALGVAALGVAAGYAIYAKDLDSQSKQDNHCSATGCDPTGQLLNMRAIANGDRATALLIAGGVLSAGGVTLYLVGRSRGRSVEVAPAASARFTGAVLAGWF